MNLKTPTEIKRTLTCMSTATKIIRVRPTPVDICLPEGKGSVVMWSSTSTTWLERGTLKWVGRVHLFDGGRTKTNTLTLGPERGSCYEACAAVAHHSRALGACEVHIIISQRAVPMAWTKTQTTQLPSAIGKKMTFFASRRMPHTPSYPSPRRAR